MRRQQPEQDDDVIATGQMHSVRDFVKLAFQIAGLDYEKYVLVDQTLFRPAEKVLLVGDSSKARRKLGWSPRTSFEDLVREMVETDCRLLAGQASV